MAAAKIKVRIRFDRPLDIRVRAWRDVLRTAHERMAEHWHRHYAKKHFTQAGASEYGYKPRSVRYLSQRKKRGRPPLVYSWATYRAVVQTAPMIRGFPTRAKLTMQTPPYVQMRPFQSNRPNLGKEIATVSGAEQAVLAMLLKREVEDGYNRMREPVFAKPG